MTHQFLQRCIIVKNNLLELRFFCPDILPNRQLLPQLGLTGLRGAHDFIGNRENHGSEIK